VDKWSLLLDLKIIAMTIWKIIKREGITQPGQATAEEFMGRGAAQGVVKGADKMYKIDSKWYRIPENVNEHRRKQ